MSSSRTRRSRRTSAALLSALLAVAACDPRAALPRPPAPLSLRGGIVIEPPELAIGETATVEVAVVTPPDHHLIPLAAPDSVEGLWILAAEQVPPQREASRAVHRVRFLVRARATGEFAWPAQTAWVQTPSGERVAVELAARPLRVVEVSREFPERSAPFSWRAPREPGRAGRFLVPALFGAGAALAALALVAGVRRARRPGREEPELTAAALLDAPARDAETALAEAEARLAEDPVAAADAASAALRLFVERTTGLPASTSTTEELAAMRAPFRLAGRWPELIGLLEQLDAARFRAGALAGLGGREDLRAQLRAAGAWMGAPLSGRSPEAAP